MSPTLDWLQTAEKRIRLTLENLRPKLLEAQGNIEHRFKADKTVVTDMDMLVENTLREELAKLDPGIHFSGEETGIDMDKQTFWLVDPIDGTEPFIRGLPFATNMVALIDNGQPVMGIVYNFLLGEYFLAIKGRGATCNGHAIRVSERPLHRAAVVMPGEFPDDNGCPHNALRKKVRMLPRMNASGYELTSIARGALEGTVYISSRTEPWDVAPGMLIIQEAGGRVENIATPGRYDYRNLYLVAANPVVFDELMDFARPMLPEALRH